MWMLSPALILACTSVDVFVPGITISGGGKVRTVVVKLRNRPPTTEKGESPEVNFFTSQLAPSCKMGTLPLIISNTEGLGTRG